MTTNQPPEAHRTVTPRQLVNATLVKMHDIMVHGKEVIAPDSNVVRVSPDAKMFEAVKDFVVAMGYQHNDNIENVIDDVVKGIPRALPASPTSDAAPDFSAPASIPLEKPRIVR